MIEIKPCYRSGRLCLINYKVNPGANNNLLPLHDLYKVKPDMDLDSLAHTIDPSVKLEAYTRNEIKQYSQVCLWLKYKDNQKQCRFYVVDRPVALLGLQTVLLSNS